MDNLELARTNGINVLVCCDDCKYLKIINDGKVYAVCEQTDFEFMPFGTDTSIHFCAYGEREKKVKLKPCPFCGKSETLELQTAKEIECDMGAPAYYAVICNFNKGGCGATSGYAATEEKAIENWNVRL